MRNFQARAVIANLFDRGFKLRRSPDDPNRLQVAPASELTAADYAKLREHRAAILGELRSRSTRRAVADLLRSARRMDNPGLTVALHDAYCERVAIVTIDGGLPLDQAELVGYEEIESLMTNTGDPAGKGG